MPRHAASPSAASPPAAQLAGASIGLRALFWIFLKSGMAFGGGSGIVGLLREELVDKRRALTGGEFVTLYGLGKIVPSGTATAVAVAFGYRFQGWLGTLASLMAMILPAFVLTVLLTIAYTRLVGSPIFSIVNVTLMPAALAVILVSAVHLGREFVSPSVELLLMVGGFACVLLLGLNPSIVLIVGGLIGAVAVREP